MNSTMRATAKEFTPEEVKETMMSESKNEAESEKGKSQEWKTFSGC